MESQLGRGSCKFSALLLVLVNDFEIGIDHVLIRPIRSRAFSSRTRSTSAGSPAGLRRNMLIQFGTDTLKPILQILCRPFDRCNIVPVELFPEVPYGVFDSSLPRKRPLQMPEQKYQMFHRQDHK